MERISNIIEIIDQFDALIFDVYGVFWNGKAIISGTLEVMKRCKSEGKVIGLLSNTTLLSEDISSLYHDRGLNLGEHYDFFTTSADVMQEIIKSHQLDFSLVTNTYKCFSKVDQKLFIGTGLSETFDISHADFVYVGVPFDKQGKRVSPDDIYIFHEDLKTYFDLKKPLLCANPDQAAPDGERLVMTQGRIGTEYEKMGGKVQWCGKPYREIFEYTLRKLRQYQITDKTRVGMIGDTLETDILGAKNAGIKSILVTDSGVLYPKIQAGESLEALCSQAGAAPDYVLSSVAA